MSKDLIEKKKKNLIECEIQVGPIPVHERTIIQPLDYIYNKGNSRTTNFLADEPIRNEKLIYKVTADITEDLFAGVRVKYLTL